MPCGLTAGWSVEQSAIIWAGSRKEKKKGEKKKSQTDAKEEPSKSTIAIFGGERRIGFGIQEAYGIQRGSGRGSLNQVHDSRAVAGRACQFASSSS
jgi:hypothetical protein